MSSSCKVSKKQQMMIFVVSFLVSLLTFSFSANIYLFRLARIQAHQLMMMPKQINVGMTLPALVVDDLSEHKISLSYSDADKPTLLYIFTPACRWCELNLKSIKVLAATEEQHYRFIGISLSREGLREYLDSRNLPFNIYVGPSAEQQRALGFYYTPQTILVSKEGTVLGNWIGAYSGPTAKALEKQFGIRLPHL